MSGLSRLQNMFRVADLRNKILFTFFIIFLFRMGSHIPVPYVDFKAIKDLQKLIYDKGPTFIPFVSPYTFTLYQSRVRSIPQGIGLSGFFVNTWYLDA